MSLRTWKKEFYPVPAIKCTTKRSALRHSIKKWKGLLPENLSKHGVRSDPPNRCIGEDSGVFMISSGTCALCLRFDCMDCALYTPRSHSGCQRYYAKWTVCDNPKPMIKFIRSRMDRRKNHRVRNG